MAKPIQFKFDKHSFSASITKVDRKKIYGYTKTEVYDDNKQLCSLANITDDGMHILPSGSSGITLLSKDGNYISRSALKAVDSEGNNVEKTPSVFDQEVELKQTTLERYLDLNVKSLYQLDIEDVPKELKENIFEFEFNYRADYEADEAFLITTDEAVFAVVGKVNEFEFYGFEAQVTEDVEDDAEDEDEFDFGML